MPNELKLTELERLTLHNIMVSIALENEKIEKYKTMINMSKSTINVLSKKLDEWKCKINKKLNKVNLDVSKVDIDAETGRIVINNVTTLPVEQTNGVNK